MQLKSFRAWNGGTCQLDNANKTIVDHLVLASGIPKHR
jgi:hypothetical protein